MKDNRPIIGITMGDPAGIGPEITAKALSQKSIYESCCPLVIGDAAVLENALEIVGKQDIAVHGISALSEAAYEWGTIDVLDRKKLRPGDFPVGEISEKAGEAAFQYVEKAIELAKQGAVDATVTNPINKAAINLAGHAYSGHTEIYAQYTGTQKYTMLLVHENLRVVHVSTHVALRQACDLVKEKRVSEVIEIAYEACRDMGIEAPRIAVAGLNPHAGEEGLFGREEIEEIRPAVEAARKQGILATGPLPPDTVFSKARGGMYDIVVAMYHDQGHIPLKMAGFLYDQKKKQWEDVSGVNITLGLPIIRTSVDHGTAFDQAGTGRASAKSLENAIDYAVRFAKQRRKKKEVTEKCQENISK